MQNVPRLRQPAMSEHKSIFIILLHPFSICFIPINYLVSTMYATFQQLVAYSTMYNRYSTILCNVPQLFDNFFLLDKLILKWTNPICFQKSILRINSFGEKWTFFKHSTIFFPKKIIFLGFSLILRTIWNLCMREKKIWIFCLIRFRTLSIFWHEKKIITFSGGGGRYRFLLGGYRHQFVSFRPQHNVKLLQGLKK